MIEEVWRRNEIDSPCVKICLIHQEEKICIGCFRTMSEITNWSKFNTQKRETIQSKLKLRASKLIPKRRGGRKQRLRNQM